jgi:hypothetical protein
MGLAGAGSARGRRQSVPSKDHAAIQYAVGAGSVRATCGARQKRARRGYVKDRPGRAAQRQMLPVASPPSSGARR